MKRQPAGASEAPQERPRRNEGGGGATREAPARQERHWRGERGDNAATNRGRERGAMRQASTMTMMATGDNNDGATMTATRMMATGYNDDGDDDHDRRRR